MKKQFFKLITGLLLTAFLALAVAEATHTAPADVLQVFFAGGLVLAAVRFAFMVANPRNAEEVNGLALDVATEFWDTIIAKNLFRGYDWLGRAKNRDGNVLNSKVVHIPQAGSVPNVKRNRVQYPVPMVKRADTDITYVIDELSSETTLVNDAEKWELSYSKIPDILDDHMKQLSKLIAQNSLYRWLGKSGNQSDLASGNIVRTTGANTGHLLSGATGNRLLLMAANVLSANTVLKSQTKKDLNPGKRALILTLESYNELKADAALDTFDKRDMLGAITRDGELVKIAGADIIITDVLPRFTNAGTPVAKDGLADDYATAATDNDVSLLVDFDFVHIAKSTTKMFYKADEPEYQGDIMNALARMGASRERSDMAGVVAIVQAAS